MDMAGRGWRAALGLSSSLEHEGSDSLVIEGLVLGQDVLHVVPLEALSQLTVGDGVTSLHPRHLLHLLVEALHTQHSSLSVS